ncbi:uncharacterized protein LOC134554395 [Prinia subflava]|uniref:uncharacterized protein LOC134554395 n=1 Tax=Prinia subflava TaxID=208062 RepID=UPI002FE00342
MTQGAGRKSAMKTPGLSAPTSCLSLPQPEFIQLFPPAPNPLLKILRKTRRCWHSSVIPRSCPGASCAGPGFGMGREEDEDGAAESELRMPPLGMTRSTPAPGCSWSSGEIFLLSHSPAPPQPGAAHQARFGRLEHPQSPLRCGSWGLGRAAGCPRAHLSCWLLDTVGFGGKAGFGVVLGGWICFARATGKRSRDVVAFPPHHSCVDSAGTAPCDPSVLPELSPAPSLKGESSCVVIPRKTRTIHSARCSAPFFPPSLRCLPSLGSPHPWNCPWMPRSRCSPCNPSPAGNYLEEHFPFGLSILTPSSFI